MQCFQFSIAPGPFIFLFHWGNPCPKKEIPILSKYPYVIDTALAASFSLSREPEVGHLLENCIFMELCRRDARATYFITQSGYEVDSVAEYPDKSMDIIQVSADLSNRVTRNRECRALEGGIFFPAECPLYFDQPERRSRIRCRQY